MILNRHWAMPSADTFSVGPIGDFVKSYLMRSSISVDPFARNCRMAKITNDLNPNTAAQYHMQAEQFCQMLADELISPDLVLLDPPYSPRQISECYKEIGLPVGMIETQSAVFYQTVRDAVDKILQPDAIVLSFGWNSVGMGVNRGYETFGSYAVLPWGSP